MSQPDISVKRGAFGGHVVTVREEHKVYTVIVVGESASASVEYDSKPANWRCRREFVSVTRELHDGPTLRRLADQARAAIAILNAPAGSNAHLDRAIQSAA